MAKVKFKPITVLRESALRALFEAKGLDSDAFFTLIKGAAGSNSTISYYRPRHYPDASPEIRQLLEKYTRHNPENFLLIWWGK